MHLNPIEDQRQKLNNLHSCGYKIYRLYMWHPRTFLHIMYDMINAIILWQSLYILSKILIL